MEAFAEVMQDSTEATSTEASTKASIKTTSTKASMDAFMEVMEALAEVMEAFADVMEAFTEVTSTDFRGRFHGDIIRVRVRLLPWMLR